MSTALGFGPIKDDDEMLDRLGSRSSTCSDDGLEGLFASWTASIDEDERAGAREVGPLGLRRVAGLPEPSPSVRVVPLHRARAAAVLGAFAIVVSGGGVAAAITQPDLAPVREVLAKAVPMLAPKTPTAVASASAATSAPALTPEVLQQIREVAKEDPQRARGMLDMLRRLAPGDPAGQELTREVEALAKEIARPTPAVVAEAPKKSPSTTTSSVAATPSASSSPTPPPASSAPTTSTGGTVAATTPSTKGPSSGHPDTPGTTAPTTGPGSGLGSAGGDQTAGTSPATSHSGTSPSATSSGSVAERPGGSGASEGSGGTGASKESGKGDGATSGAVAESGSGAGATARTSTGSDAD